MVLSLFTPNKIYPPFVFVKADISLISFAGVSSSALNSKKKFSLISLVITSPPKDRKGEDEGRTEKPAGGYAEDHA
jgi:hypothetical protein